jgi:tRNA threonylcarbamoyladenosine biosynthesis protein TsaE
MSLQISYTKADIHEAAHQLWQWAHPFQVFAFSGSLGAGKTTFIHALCDMIKVQDVVSSPTFALINEYRFNNEGTEEVIYHMDWYRLRDADEAVDAGMEDTLDTPGAYCFIEWPEKAPELLESRPHILISLRTSEEEDGRILNAIRQ